MDLSRTYDHTFFTNIAGGSQLSARRIVPTVTEWLAPRSVVDLGCGDGSWLAEFRRHGVDDVLGVDGHRLPSSLMQLPPSMFVRSDLRRRFSIDRHFDLAISLETAEHLPKARAEDFVGDLVRLAPHVLFSAAIPFQRGTHHVNCQWPDYWQALFARHDFLAFDLLRPAIWDDSSVEFWFRQNIVLYVEAATAERNPLLRQHLPSGRQPVRRLVHPELCATWEGNSLRELVQAFPAAIKDTLRRRLRWS